MPISAKQGNCCQPLARQRFRGFKVPFLSTWKIAFRPVPLPARGCGYSRRPLLIRFRGISIPLPTRCRHAEPCVEWLCCGCSLHPFTRPLKGVRGATMGCAGKDGSLRRYGGSRLCLAYVPARNRKQAWGMPRLGSIHFTTALGSELRVDNSGRIASYG